MLIWVEREKLFKNVEEERKVNLVNKGILDWVIDNMKKGNREFQEKMLIFQKEKDVLIVQYFEKRSIVDGLNEEFQRKIVEYFKYQDSGKLIDLEIKKRVIVIYEIKEKLKKEFEILK